MEQMKQKYLAILCIALFCIGSWLVFFLPGQRADKALDAAQISFAEVQKEFSVIDAKMNGMDWYKKSYLESVSPVIKIIQKEVAIAESELGLATAAKGSKEKKSHADVAKKRMTDPKEGTLALIGNVKEILEKYEKLAIEAKADFAVFQKEITAQDDEHQKTKKTLEAESYAYLSKYIEEMASALVEAKKENSSAIQIADEIRKLLPPQDEKFSGDPEESMKLLKQGFEKLVSAEKQIAWVKTELGFQRDALEKAGPTVVLSGQQLGKASAHLRKVIETTPLLPNKALKDAFAREADAKQLLSQANQALVAEVEDGKKDLALAYRSGLNIALLSEEITKETDRQVELHNNSVTQLDRLKARIQESKNGLSHSAASQRVLVSHHARSVWSGVSGNLDNAGKYLVSAEDLLAGAYVSFQDQKFSNTLDNIKKANDELNYSAQLFSAVDAVSKKLEVFRSEWPQAEKRAQSTINDEEGYINSYGSYASSAKSDFEDAENLLGEARLAASQKDYESAVNKARKAENLAEGTGNRAYAAYEDSQEDSSSSFGSGGFGSGSDDSGFGSGGFGGGSDSGSWGGGSDGGSWGGGSSGGDGGGWSGGSSGSDGGGWE